jgi:hypothetical protein
MSTQTATHASGPTLSHINRHSLALAAVRARVSARVCVCVAQFASICERARERACAHADARASPQGRVKERDLQGQARETET